jgi:hypothetical protein
MDNHMYMASFSKFYKRELQTKMQQLKLTEFHFLRREIGTSGHETNVYKERIQLCTLVANCTH